MNSPACLCSVSLSKGGAHLSLVSYYLLYLQPVLLLPPMPTPSLCRDFDRPKVSLMAELFNSVLCQKCLRRCGPCMICPGSMMQTSLRWLKGHDANSNQPCKESLQHILYTTVRTTSDLGSTIYVYICINLNAIKVPYFSLHLQNEMSINS